MQHHFDVDLACKYGITEAILINHFEYWIELNEANEANFFEGRYWTFNSVRALLEIFPYLSEKKIRNAINHLIEEKILLCSSFNKSPYDRTRWYAFSDSAKLILLNRKSDVPKKANVNCQKGEPIPDNNTNNNPYNNTDNKESVYARKRATRSRSSPPSLEEISAYCRERRNSVDPEAFRDYYQARGWKYGQGKPVVDWKAAVRTWEKREKERDDQKNDPFRNLPNSSRESFPHLPSATDDCWDEYGRPV